MLRSTAKSHHSGESCSDSNTKNRNKYNVPSIINVPSIYDTGGSRLCTSDKRKTNRGEF